MTKCLIEAGTGVPLEVSLGAEDQVEAVLVKAQIGAVPVEALDSDVDQEAEPAIPKNEDSCTMIVRALERNDGDVVVAIDRN